MMHLFLAAVILAGDPAAQTNQAPLEADEVFACNFESGIDPNFDAWPDQWTRRRGRGYPGYLPIEIVPDSHSTGTNHCLQIKLDGGAAQIYSPAIPIVPQFSYQLTARIRTRGLRNDVVSYSVSFFDGEEKLVEVHESPLMRDVKQWNGITIGPVTPAGDRVRTAVVSVHVRPTDQADLVGEVWIDDLWLGRLPKMTLEINGENGVFTDPKSVAVICRVSGFKNKDPEITFDLLDVYGTVLENLKQTMKGEPESSRVRAARSQSAELQQPGFAGNTSWHPNVDKFGSGFYTIRVSTPGHSDLPMTQEVNFVVMPPLTRRKSGEFGWSLADGERPLPIRSLPGLLSQTGVHWVKYPVWFSAKETRRAEEIAWFAERLSSFDIKVVGLLDQPPTDLRALFSDAERLPIATAFADKAVWHPALDPVMTRLSLKIRWWQLGRDDDTSFASYPDLGAKLNEIRNDLASFGQAVNVGVPWRVLEERRQSGPLPWAFFSLIEEQPLTAEELKSYVEIKPEDKSKQWVILQPLRQKDYTLEARARDLVQRMLAAKIAEADAVFVPEPFDSEFGLMQADGSPGPLLLPWRTTSMLVGGSAFGGSMKLQNGSENYVFLHNDEAVVVIWNERSLAEDICLGEQVRQYDVWGRQSTPTSEPNADGVVLQRIHVGPMPTFITGVNPEIAKWRMGFRFETEGLASVFGREQVVTYRFSNPFPQAIAGKVKFHRPSDWKVEGLERQFKVGPGDTLRGTLRIQLGPESISGPQPVQVDFDLTGERNHRFSLFETLQVGLGDVVFQLDTRVDEKGNLLVEQHLTNNTDKFVSFKCYLTVPGRRRVRKQVFNVGRGQKVDTYVLSDAKELLGQEIRFRAEEINGDRVINDHINAHY